MLAYLPRNTHARTSLRACGELFITFRAGKRCGREWINLRELSGAGMMRWDGQRGCRFTRMLRMLECIRSIYVCTVGVKCFGLNGNFDVSFK